jgi:hypothetical protein
MSSTSVGIDAPLDCVPTHNLNSHQDCTKTMSEVNASLDPVCACYICWENGSNKDGPLVCDSACCGKDAGFSHLSCLVASAESESKNSLRNMNQFIMPWIKCRSCLQLYQSELQVMMANKLILFIKGHPHNQEFLVEAINVKLFALANMLQYLAMLLQHTSDSEFEGGMLPIYLFCSHIHGIRKLNLSKLKR